MNRGLCQVCRLGKIEYRRALELQEGVAAARAAGAAADTLLLLEHPATYTLGRRGNEENLLVSQKTLADQGVAVYRVDRGGDVTFHGPGQLVAYPILDLNDRRRNVVRYVRELEETMIRALASFGVLAGRMSGLTGVWVGDEKIGAIGVRVDSRGITRHGFALNVTTELEYFLQIVPCGIRHKQVTTLVRVLGHAVELVQVGQAVVESFGQVFRMEMIEVDPASLCPSFFAPASSTG